MSESKARIGELERKERVLNKSVISEDGREKMMRKTDKAKQFEMVNKLAENMTWMKKIITVQDGIIATKNKIIAEQEKIISSLEARTSNADKKPLAPVLQMIK